MVYISKFALNIIWFVILHFGFLLQRLYELGARKFVVNSIGALSCIPAVLDKYSVTNTAQCLEDNDQNRRVSEYNTIVFESLPQLQSTLPGSKFVYANTNKVLKDVIKSPNLHGTYQLGLEILKIF